MSSGRQSFFSEENSASKERGEAWFEGVVKNKISLRDSVDESIQLHRDLLPPVTKINCEYENIYAELITFTEKKNYQFGNVCPANSPLKPLRLSQGVVVEVESNLRMVSISGKLDSDSLDESWANKVLIDMGRFNGKNYGRLMQVAKTMHCHLQKMGKERLKEYFSCPAKLSNNIFEKLFNKLTIIDVIVFMALVEKYPLYSAEKIYCTISEAVRSGKPDIYMAYKTFDNFLFKKTLTRDALGPYLFAAEVKRAAAEKREYVEVEEVEDKMHLG